MSGFKGDFIRAWQFEDWIETLETEVIQEEYGYEPGEFNVTPENWRPLFLEGLSPLDAFKRALNTHCEARKAEEAPSMTTYQPKQKREGDSA
jgi:hypothetical protein